MGIFDRLLGGRKDRAGGDGTAASFAREACRSRTCAPFQIGEVAAVIDALQDELCRQYPGLDRGEAFSHAQGGLTLICPNCGKLTHQAVEYLCALRVIQMGEPSSITYLGPNVTALAKGRCPGCGGTTVNVLFDPKTVKGRQRTSESDAAKDAGLSEFKPACTAIKFQASLDISPDQGMVCFVAPAAGASGQVVACRTGTDALEWSIPVASAESCQCAFVGCARLLVVSGLSDGESLAQLVNTGDGSVVAELKLPRVSFHPLYRVTDANVNTGTFVAGGWPPLHETVLMLKATDDGIALSTCRLGGDVDPPGPRIGTDGKCYAIERSDKLVRIEGGAARRVGPGRNCICFTPSGWVYCGGGYADRSGESALRAANLSSGQVFEVPWGKEPIDEIALAGEDELLLANEVSKFHVGRYPIAVVTLFSVARRRKRWSLEISDLKPYHNPIPLSVPDEGWALIQTGRMCKRIRLADGQATHALPKEPAQVLRARWLASQRLLYVARNADFGKAGLLECYRLD